MSSSLFSGSLVSFGTLMTFLPLLDFVVLGTKADRVSRSPLLVGALSMRKEDSLLGFLSSAALGLCVSKAASSSVVPLLSLDMDRLSSADESFLRVRDMVL